MGKPTPVTKSEVARLVAGLNEQEAQTLDRVIRGCPPAIQGYIGDLQDWIDGTNPARITAEMSKTQGRVVGIERVPADENAGEEAFIIHVCVPKEGWDQFDIDDMVFLQHTGRR